MFHLALSFGTNTPAGGAVCDDGWAGGIGVLIIGTAFVAIVAFPTN